MYHWCWVRAAEVGRRWTTGRRGRRSTFRSCRAAPERDARRGRRGRCNGCCPPVRSRTYPPGKRARPPYRRGPVRQAFHHPPFNVHFAFDRRFFALRPALIEQQAGQLQMSIGGSQVRHGDGLAEGLAADVLHGTLYVAFLVATPDITETDAEAVVRGQVSQCLGGLLVGVLTRQLHHRGTHVVIDELTGYATGLSQEANVGVEETLHVLPVGMSPVTERSANNAWCWVTYRSAVLR